MSAASAGARKLSQWPVLRELPIRHHGLWEIFSTSAVSSTLSPPKKRELDDLALSFVLRRKRSKRVVNGDEIFRGVARDRQVLVQRHPIEQTAALLIVSGPGEINEHAANQASRHREVVRAILPLAPTEYPPAQAFYARRA